MLNLAFSLGSDLMRLTVPRSNEMKMVQGRQNCRAGLSLHHVEPVARLKV